MLQCTSGLNKSFFPSKEKQSGVIQTKGDGNCFFIPFLENFRKPGKW